MKILSNNKYYEIENNLRILADENKEIKENAKDMNKFYDELLNSIYYDLFDLKNSLKGNISKEKIKIKIQEMLIKIGGKR